MFFWELFQPLVCPCSLYDPNASNVFKRRAKVIKSKRISELGVSPCVYFQWWLCAGLCVTPASGYEWQIEIRGALISQAALEWSDCSPTPSPGKSCRDVIMMVFHSVPCQDLNISTQRNIHNSYICKTIIHMQIACDCNCNSTPEKITWQCLYVFP